jgi:hypothetical protein
MHARFIYLVVIIIAVLLALRWFARTPPGQVKKTLVRVALIGGAGLLIVLAATGRLHWLFAVLGGMIPFAQRALGLLRTWNLFKSMRGRIPGLNPGGTTRQQQDSTIETRFLRMTLDHTTGELNGTILDGTHRGCLLQELTRDELIGLLKEYRVEDIDSATLLESYLDRCFGPEWRGEAPEMHHDETPPQGSGMTQQEAWSILGLDPGASKKDIREAHRRLMQKLHPDRGGSTYLAAKINQAKDLLLDYLK